ncbi:MAG: M28 family peptidase [Treponema sp.]|nr:M28 family peptidase [Treponema sp.]
MNIPEALYEFTAHDCDRCAYIQGYLSKRGVDSTVISIDGKKHIYVTFPSSFYNPLFKIKTVIAHYDRIGGPGACDNSAAIFQIMDWASRLVACPAVYNVRIFFTDGEELGSEGGVKEQGAFGIASLYKKLGITNDDVYVFDACGRGTIPILGKMEMGISVPQNFRQKCKTLYERTQQLLRVSASGRWLILPIPYSDNAGFLACGIPAVAITLLPEEEADFYLKNLVCDKNLESYIKNPVEEDEKHRNMIPHTWQLFHTRQDTVGNLTPASFTVMAHLLDVLGREKAL